MDRQSAFTQSIRLASKKKQSDNCLANAYVIFGVLARQLIPPNCESVDKHLECCPPIMLAFVASEYIPRPSGSRSLAGHSAASETVTPASKPFKLRS
jgi:hypothetical protein